MRITALTENTSRCGLDVEHGLSLLIQKGERRILFDFGQTALFAQNAALLGCDLQSVDCAVLSHGHYDHGGGMARFLELNQNAPVYISRFAFEPHFNAAGKSIGLDEALRENSRLIFTEGTVSIEPGMALFDCNEVGFDLPVSGLTAEEDGVLRPDSFRHEQYLLLEENGKRVLFSGCSHKGVLNLVRFFRPDVLVGGFHFFKLPLDEKLCALARSLAAYPTIYYTCHCTGTAQYEHIRPLMPRLRYLSAGETIEL